MPEQTSFEFTHREVVIALLKAQGITSGLWQLHVRFGLKAMNVGSGPEDLMPSAIVPLVAVGIRKADERGNLTVDAAEVNPAVQQTAPRRIGAGKTAKAAKK
jgi:hypothetical protein